MKKLIIGMAVVALACAANAATVSWTITGIKQDGVSLTTGHNYMFFATSAAAAQTQISAIVSAAGTGASAFQTAMASANWNDVKKATTAGTFSIGTTAALGGYATLPTNAQLGLTGSTTYYAYGVLFNTTTITDDSKYMIVQGTPTTAGFLTNDDGSAYNKSVLMGLQADTWYAVGGSSPVPEPTSGLLLLLGMAGLALKRKNA